MYTDYEFVLKVVLIVCIAVIGVAFYNEWKPQQIADCCDPMLDPAYISEHNKNAQEMVDRMNAQYAAERIAKKPKWSQEGYKQKLGEVLVKYEVSAEEWFTNTDNAWIHKWEIIKEMNVWQMERLDN